MDAIIRTIYSEEAFYFMLCKYGYIKKSWENRKIGLMCINGGSSIDISIVSLTPLKYLPLFEHLEHTLHLI
jgi:hypothetical protein